VNDTELKVVSQENSISTPTSLTSSEMIDEINSTIFYDLLSTSDPIVFDANKTIIAELREKDWGKYQTLRNAAYFNANIYGTALDKLADRGAIELAETAPAQEPEQIPSHLTPQLDNAALYGLAGDIVRTLAPETEASDAALLAHVLTFFGNVVGRTAWHIVGADKHYGNLFVTLVGDSSVGRKGAAASMVRHLFRSVDVEWEANNIATGLSTGEGLIHEVHDDIRKWDVGNQKHVITEPATPDKRRCIIESELASMLHQFEKRGNILSPLIRQAWDGQTLRVMSKTTGETATNAHISIIGHITREELSRYLTATEQANGLGNRFIWMLVRRNKLLPHGGNIYSLDLKDITRRLQTAIQKAQQTDMMQRSPAANTLWDSVVYGALSPLEDKHHGLVGSLLSRAPAQVLRLSCIYALLDGTDIISPDHIKAALAVWQYSEASVKLIFGDKMGAPIADRILSELKVADDNEMTKTEINNLFDRHQKATAINDAIDLLETTGHIRIKKETTPGRPVEKIQLIKCELSELSEKGR